MEKYSTEEYRGYKINIYYDDNNGNDPRDWSNIATFVCAHRNYNLGDRQDIDVCVQELFDKHVPSDVIIKYFVESRQAVLKDNETFDADAVVGGDSFSYYYEWKENGHEYCILFDPDDECEREKAAGEMADELTNEEKLHLCEVCNALVWLPISMYEHSGITLWLGSKWSHSDAQWDCSSVGFAYVEREVAEKEKAGWKDEMNWKDFAYMQMQNEMNVYDAYIRGEVYGYSVEDENGDDTDMSCWGFIGSDEIDRMIDEAEAEIDATIEQKQKVREDNIRIIITNIHQLSGQVFVTNDKSVRIGNDMFGFAELQVAKIIKSHVKDYNKARFAELPDELIEDMVKQIKIA